MALLSPQKPWILLASSREVYGEQESQPVSEDADFRPKNAYAWSKVAAERFLEDARCAGLTIAVVRFSNVYGSTNDYPDRVLPAFASAAVEGKVLLVEGPAQQLDFTHVRDVVDGMIRVANILSSGERHLPPIQLVSGVPMTLGGVANMALQIAGTRAHIVEVPSRVTAVARFIGSPARANAILGWQARIDIVSGLSELIADFRAEGTGRYRRPSNV
jgi:nucleoside-diphosphate-sugar epimerase